MNTSMIKGLIIGGVVATAGGAVAGYNMVRDDAPPVPEFAEVLHVEPAMTQVAQSEEVCRDVEVVHQKQARDERRIAGTATGAVLGGLIGNQVGGGNGKKLATVVGAVAGGTSHGHRERSCFRLTDSEFSWQHPFVRKPVSTELTQHGV